MSPYDGRIEKIAASFLNRSESQSILNIQVMHWNPDTLAVQLPTKSHSIPDFHILSIIYLSLCLAAHQRLS